MSYSVQVIPHNKYIKAYYHWLSLILYTSGHRFENFHGEIRQGHAV